MKQQASKACHYYWYLPWLCPATMDNDDFCNGVHAPVRYGVSS